MSKNKGVPKFQNPPPPPDPIKKKLTVEGTIEQVLKIIHQHEPADQNKVIESVNNAIAADRHDAYMKAREDERQAGSNMERYMASTHGIEEFLKARAAAKELSK